MGRGLLARALNGSSGADRRNEGVDDMRSVPLQKASAAPEKTPSLSAVCSINQSLEQLPRTKRKVAAYMLEHREEVLFMTAYQVSHETGVDTATVVRTAQALGYAGYPELQEALRREFLNSVSPLNIMRSSADGSGDMGRLATRIITQDIANLEALRKSFDRAKLAELVKRIHSAPRILVVGLDLAGVLARYLEYLLQYLELPAIGATCGGGRLRNQIIGLKPRGLLIGISFKRCLRETVNAVRQAREHGIFTVSITDSFASPLIRVSDMFFLTPINSILFSDSYVAPLSLLGSIILACAEHNESRSLKILEKIEKLDDESNRWY